MAILVSGGAGYIGSHTCIELLNAGFDIVVADNYYNASPVVLDRVKQITGKDFRFYQADMTKHEDVEKIFTECPDIDAVIQFAAYKAVGETSLLVTKVACAGQARLLPKEYRFFLTESSDGNSIWMDFCFQ